MNAKTGYTIYSEIVKLNDEIKELVQALDGMEESSLPYRILNSTYNEKKAARERAYHMVYIPKD